MITQPTPNYLTLFISSLVPLLESMIVKKIGRKGERRNKRFRALIHLRRGPLKSQRMTNLEIRERILISPYEMELEKEWRKKKWKPHHPQMVRILFKGDFFS